jgi:hypothetical protein
MRAILAVASGLLLLGASAAQAQVSVPGWPYWSSNGAGCVPGDPAIQANSYFITAGSVNYRSAGSGLVTLYCPINQGIAPYFDTQLRALLMTVSCPDNNYRLRLTYTDSDGTGPAVGVAAQVIRLAKSNGTFLGAVPGAVIAANSSAETTPTSVLSEFTHAFAFSGAYYYARVDMARAAGTTNVATFYGVAIECR